MVGQKAFFFDRDGILIRDCHLPSKKEDIHIMPGIADFMAKLKNTGFMLFMISNQTVVSRGILKMDEMIKLNNYILEEIKKDNPDAIVDKCFFCTHHPNADMKEFRMNCKCRKPHPGMFMQAKNEFNINLDKSYMIGDRISDVIAGNLAGCKTLLLKSGKHKAPMIISYLEVDEKNKQADFTASSFKEVWEILKYQEGFND